MKNLCNLPEAAEIQNSLNKRLDEMLRQRNDHFLSGHEYMKKWDYTFDPGDLPGT
jgi:hypothetical protein